MIKVAILGADSPVSGELIRILAMHPDVEIVSAQAVGHDGIAVKDVHHGLIGETELKFTSNVDFSSVNVIFVDAGVANGDALMELAMTGAGPKLILIGASDRSDQGSGCVYGVPEINRKRLVRGAKVSVVPAPVASMALVALFPFASKLLLNSDISIHISAPTALLNETDLEAVSKEIETGLKNVQLSYSGKVKITAEASEARRSTLMNISFDCKLQLDQAKQLYNCYDDHHFSFLSDKPVGVSEVAGTNKCVIFVDKPDSDKMELSVVADSRMRGGAAEAVHIMNLMFGLHEKTGLYLKAIDFDRY